MIFVPGKAKEMGSERVEMQSTAEHSVFGFRVESETLSGIGHPEKLCPGGAGRAPRQQGGAARGKAQRSAPTTYDVTPDIGHTVRKGAAVSPSHVREQHQTSSPSRLVPCGLINKKGAGGMNKAAHQLWQSQIYVSPCISSRISVLYIEAGRPNGLTPSIQGHELQGTTEIPDRVGLSLCISTYLYSCAPRKYITHGKTNAKSGMAAYTRLKLRVVFQRCPILALAPLVLPPAN
jgi:hypothetical protein